jgi:hypothetical protein
MVTDKDDGYPDNLFHRKARLKAGKENISIDEAVKLLNDEVAARHRGEYSTIKANQAR